MARPATTGKSRPLPPAIHEMVRRIVAGFDPEKIILFGSYARGTAGPDSDADLMVVMDFEGGRRAKAADVCGEVGAVGLAKDLILVTPEELECGRREPGSLVHTALQEGKVLYDRTRSIPSASMLSNVLKST